MIDETTAGLLEAAGPQMYRRNAFRITGLPTHADRRTARQRQQQITPALELGADVDLGHSLPVRPDEIRGAFDRILGDPRRRLVDELFWRWDGPGATCGCPRSLHRDHDAAVEAHSAALDLEAGDGGLTGRTFEESEQLWSDAARLWGKALRRAAFWDHVRHRIAVLDDRQLDESVIDRLRDGLPAALVKPLVALAAAEATAVRKTQVAELPRIRLAAAGAASGRLAEQAREWPLVPARVVEDQLEEAASPLYDVVRTAMNQASARLEGGSPEDAAAEVYKQAVPALTLLEALVPHRRHRRTASARNDVAVLLNNCATALVGSAESSASGNATDWFRTAGQLATDPVTQQTVKTNGDALRDMAEAFAQIRNQVDQLVALGRISLARKLLRDVRRQLGGGAGTEEIDRMLARLGGRQQQPSRERARTTRAPLVTGHRRRVPALVWAVLPIVVVVVGYWLMSGCSSDSSHLAGHTAVISADRIRDNAPVGRCIEEESDWKVGDRVATVIPCSRPHWGEVLAYAPLVDTSSRYMPNSYPGRNQSVALSHFRCELALAQLGLSDSGLVTKYEPPGEEAWRGKADNYATCVVHRADDGDMSGGDRVAGRTRADSDAYVLMNTFGRTIVENAPVGACIATKTDLAVETADVPALPCDQEHWAEIVGYPVLYSEPGKWPGDKAVYAKAEAACAKLTTGLRSGLSTHIAYPGNGWWDSPEVQIYAVCAVSQDDDQLFREALQ